MLDTTAVVAVKVRPSPVAAWFHRLLTHPVVEVDGREYASAWGTREIPVTPGPHRISVYFRYRGQHRARLAESSREFTAEQGVRRVHITARLGPLNHSRFRIGDPVAHA
ncbi:hypothetical protein GCM10020221_27110 [Streptomyces thioluteus]|uniref:Uncharacterized protein n=1 Tax=Streptomyces thioluteus TaxID=66431 RepID=A0ABN3WWR3_STRTU